MIGGDDVFAELLIGRARLTIHVSFFDELTPILLEASDLTNPSEFFTSRDGLHEYEGFEDYIIVDGEADQYVTAKSTTIGYVDILEEVKTATVCALLPKKYIFTDVNTFLVYLSSLLIQQWGGKEGTLINNGQFNIFYVKIPHGVITVRICWSAHYAAWDCDAGPNDAGEMLMAGTRVFSATVA